MASVARGIFDTIFLFNILIFNSNADARYPPIKPKRIEISYHWEKDGTSYQDKKTDKLVVKQGANNLRLLCKVDPPLPETEEHFALRNHLIRFEKIYPEHYVLTGLRFWTDDQQRTAISLEVESVELFGTYVCVYGEMRKTVDILADNEQLIKSLPPPTTLEHIISSTFIRKNLMENIQSNNTDYYVEKPEFNCEVKKSGIVQIF
ncbi:uncharacterized protein LOC114527690 [Dendronephthya gigantea]|uniref:uncharacterized protein LOC114527690 n=1 Tax=Dendronephthya gigantea TaxID=151771 RepID=UPI00106BC53A|nr:uncharacterized protein LOC114527690 [Dendronephthya gigantea]